jgi:CheY-like chemotaxis protein
MPRFYQPDLTASEASMTKRILVVEDKEDNRQIVRDLLTANDYEMTEAEKRVCREATTPHPIAEICS